MPREVFPLPARTRSRTGARLEKILVWVIYLVAITVAEWVATYASPRYGLVIYAIIFALLLFHSHLESQSPERTLLLALALAPLIRIVNLALPLASFYHLYRQVIVSIPIVLATLGAMWVLNFGVDEVGLTPRRVPFQVVVAASGIPLGWVQYQILQPQRLVVGLTWQDMVLPGLIFVLCSGFVGELIFRGVMQRASMEVLGKWGILYVSVLFGVLSMEHFSVPNMVFMFGVAVFFSWVVRKTGSILGVAFAHGIMTMMLYLVMTAVM